MLLLLLYYCLRSVLISVCSLMRERNPFRTVLRGNQYIYDRLVMSPRFVLALSSSIARLPIIKLLFTKENRRLSVYFNTRFGSPSLTRIESNQLDSDAIDLIDFNCSLYLQCF